MKECRFKSADMLIFICVALPLVLAQDEPADPLTSDR